MAFARRDFLTKSVGLSVLPWLSGTRARAQSAAASDVVLDLDQNNDLAIFRLNEPYDHRVLLERQQLFGSGFSFQDEDLCLPLGQLTQDPRDDLSALLISSYGNSQGYFCILSCDTSEFQRAELYTKCEFYVDLDDVFHGVVRENQTLHMFFWNRNHESLKVISKTMGGSLETSYIVDFSLPFYAYFIRVPTELFASDGNFFALVDPVSDTHTYYQFVKFGAESKLQPLVTIKDNECLHPLWNYQFATPQFVPGLKQGDTFFAPLHYSHKDKAALILRRPDNTLAALGFEDIQGTYTPRVLAISEKPYPEEDYYVYNHFFDPHLDGDVFLVKDRKKNQVFVLSLEDNCSPLMNLKLSFNESPVALNVKDSLAHKSLQDFFIHDGRPGQESFLSSRKAANSTGLSLEIFHIQTEEQQHNIETFQYQLHRQSAPQEPSQYQCIFLEGNQSQLEVAQRKDRAPVLGMSSSAIGYITKNQTVLVILGVVMLVYCFIFRPIRDGLLFVRRDLREHKKWTGLIRRDHFSDADKQFAKFNATEMSDFVDVKLQGYQNIPGKGSLLFLLQPLYEKTHSGMDLLKGKELSVETLIRAAVLTPEELPKDRLGPADVSQMHNRLLDVVMQKFRGRGGPIKFIFECPSKGNFWKDCWDEMGVAVQYLSSKPFRLVCEVENDAIDEKFDRIPGVASLLASNASLEQKDQAFALTIIYSIVLGMKRDAENLHKKDLRIALKNSKGQAHVLLKSYLQDQFTGERFFDIAISYYNSVCDAERLLQNRPVSIDTKLIKNLLYSSELYRWKLPL